MSGNPRQDLGHKARWPRSLSGINFPDITSLALAFPRPERLRRWCRCHCNVAPTSFHIPKRHSFRLAENHCDPDNIDGGIRALRTVFDAKPQRLRAAVVGLRHRFTVVRLASHDQPGRSAVPEVARVAGGQGVVSLIWGHSGISASMADFNAGRSSVTTRQIISGSSCPR